MRTDRRCGAALAFGGALLCSPAHALVDTKPFGSLSYQYDDNVYRFANETEARNQRGESALGDTLRKFEVGTWVGVEYGRQALRARGAIQQYRYGDFEELDRTENELETRLEWALGIPWSGLALYESSRTLESLTSRDSIEPGFLQRHEAELSVGYEIGPRWQLQGAAGALRKRLTRLEAQNSNLDETRGRLGFAYASAIGIAGAAVELTRGDFPNREVAAPAASEEGPLDGVLPPPEPDSGSGSGGDTGYEQTDYLLNARNDISGVSAIETEFGYTQRTSPSAANDFQGWTGRLRYEWRRRTKTTVGGQLFRRLRDTEEGNANYVDEAGTSITVRHTLTSVLSAVVEGHLADQNYRGSPTVENSGAQSEDRVTGFELGVAYTPRPWISLTPLVRQERRASSLTGREYDFTIAGLTLEVRAD